MSSTITTPKVGTWVFDPAHTTIGVTARHMMLTKVRGTFSDFTGSIEVGDTAEESAVTVTIEAATINTGVADRDNHLRSPDFLDVETFPSITFKSTSVERDGSGFALKGDLTIKDVTNPIILDLEYGGTVADPWGNEKAVFSASGTFDREAWSLGWNVALEAGGWLVSKEFKIEIEAQAKQA